MYLPDIVTLQFFDNSFSLVSNMSSKSKAKDNGSICAIAIFLLVNELVI